MGCAPLHAAMYRGHDTAPAQALMTAEMSTLMPCNGGYVVWAQCAFGDLMCVATAWLRALTPHLLHGRRCWTASVCPAVCLW